MSKFSGIIFPFFGKIAIPSQVIYGLESAAIINEKGYLVLVDNKNIPNKDYITRLSKIDENKRINFDYTAITLQELINSPIKWGVDSTAKIYNLNTKEPFKAKTVKINKVKGDLLWAKQVSYPFKIKDNLTGIINKYIYVTLVYIDNTWYLYNFGYKYLPEREIML